MNIIAEATSGGFVHEYISLLHDFPHVAFELTYEAITGVIVYPIGRHAWNRAKRRAIKKHDAKFHPHAHSRVDSDTGSVVE